MLSKLTQKFWIQNTIIYIYSSLKNKQICYIQFLHSSRSFPPKVNIYKDPYILQLYNILDCFSTLIFWAKFTATVGSCDIYDSIHILSIIWVIMIDCMHLKLPTCWFHFYQLESAKKWGKAFLCVFLTLSSFDIDKDTDQIEWIQN